MSPENIGAFFMTKNKFRVIHLMNILIPNSADAQTLTVTPRSERGASYTIVMVEDGTRVTQTVNITATFSGSFMECEGVFSVKKNNGYTFRVLTNTGIEIYRGKAVGSDAAQPLKNSIYE